MAVIIELPPEVELSLRAQIPNLDADAKEAFLIGFYRQEKLTRYELSHALGLSRFETDGILKKHKVTEDLPTTEEVEEDLRRMRGLLSR